MKKKPEPNERELVGRWLFDKGKIIEDETSKQIHWLTASVFRQVAVDGDNWCSLYLDPNTGFFWELTYPHSDMHGGGPPNLKRLKKIDVNKKYRMVDL